MGLGMDGLFSWVWGHLKYLYNGRKHFLLCCMFIYCGRSHGSGPICGRKYFYTRGTLYEAVFSFVFLCNKYCLLSSYIRSVYMYTFYVWFNWFLETSRLTLDSILSQELLSSRVVAIDKQLCRPITNKSTMCIMSFICNHCNLYCAHNRGLILKLLKLILVEHTKTCLSLWGKVIPTV